MEIWAPDSELEVWFARRIHHASAKDFAYSGAGFCSEQRVSVYAVESANVRRTQRRNVCWILQCIETGQSELHITSRFNVALQTAADDEADSICIDLTRFVEAA
jgi:hypothetical protein